MKIQTYREYLVLCAKFGVIPQTEEKYYEQLGREAENKKIALQILREYDNQKAER